MSKYSEMSMAQLRREAGAAADLMAKGAAIVSEVRAEVAIRANETYIKAYKDKGDDYGTARGVVDGVPLKFTTPKKVTYDEKALNVIYRRIDRDTAKGLFKIKVSVTETALKGLDDEELKKEIEAARTTTPGKVTIDFEITA